MPFHNRFLNRGESGFSIEAVRNLRVVFCFRRRRSSLSKVVAILSPEFLRLLYAAFTKAAFNFRHDDQPFFFIAFDGKGRAAVPAQGRIAVFHRLFDVLGIMIASVNDKQIFAAAGNEEFPSSQKAHIAGAQKRPFGVPGCKRLKDVPAQVRLVPIALRHTVTGHPDLPNLPWRTGQTRIRIDNHNLLVIRHMTASH